MENDKVVLMDDPVFWMGLVISMVILIGWSVFFSVAWRTKESLKDIIDRSFLHNLTVILIVAMTGWLAYARILSGEAAGAILSGIGGYVLGSLKSQQKSE